MPTGGVEARVAVDAEHGLVRQTDVLGAKSSMAWLISSIRASMGSFSSRS